jgi:hypothetical protein
MQGMVRRLTGDGVPLLLKYDVERPMKELCTEMALTHGPQIGNWSGANRHNASGRGEPHPARRKTKSSESNRAVECTYVNNYIYNGDAENTGNRRHAFQLVASHDCDLIIMY